MASINNATFVFPSGFGTGLGTPVQLSATAATPTSVHQPQGGDAGIMDEVYAWVWNSNSAPVTVNTRFGTGGQWISLTIPAYTKYLILSGERLGNSANNLVQMYASTSNVFLSANINRVLG